ncbi:MAG: F0F1 ATP synthase subunit epsilon [SAR202 cluster bacterium]|nr:F0F1 ATP synthase subunit epsilon [SAR202 cluster bacterium]
MATMRLEIVTAERLVYSEEVSSVVAPGFDGELGILPHHAPLLTLLKPGELRIRKDGQETLMAVTGGFMEVFENKVVVLADAAERDSEIDLARAEEALKRAKERIVARGADLNLEHALSSMRRAEARLKVARRRRGTTAGPTRPG